VYPRSVRGSFAVRFRFVFEIFSVRFRFVFGSFLKFFRFVFGPSGKAGCAFRRFGPPAYGLARPIFDPSLTPGLTSLGCPIVFDRW
jgi:hypothetical protein